MSHQNTEITLWGSPLSPFVRKVQVALAEKNLTYKHISIPPKAFLEAEGKEVPAAFAKASPLGKIPAMQDGDYYLADSAVISAYLEKKYQSGKALYPSHPESYARALWFENYGDNVFSNITRKIFFEAVIKPSLLNLETNQAVVEQAITKELPPCLDYLEKEVSAFNWLAGDDFSMADVAVATHLICLDQAKFLWDNERWAALQAYKEKVLARDSFKKLMGN